MFENGQKTKCTSAPYFCWVITASLSELSLISVSLVENSCLFVLLHILYLQTFYLLSILDSLTRSLSYNLFFSLLYFRCILFVYVL